MIARGFVERGATVYVSSRKAEACRTTAQELSELGPGLAKELPADLATREGIETLAGALRSEAAGLDVLVNNAGTAWLEPFDDLSEKGWDKVMDLNLKAPFFLTQALAPLLRAAASRERPAKVIHVASIDGISVNPLETYPYQASKAGLIHLTRRMALRLIRDDIVVSAIAPGAFATDMNVHARDEEEKVAARVPAGRVGRDDDMVGAAVYLASRAGDYVVGETLVVDGGVTWARG